MGRVVVILVSLAALLSCSRNGELDRAEALVRDYPDSALAVLDGVDRTSLSRREAARYDYLSADAFYNTYYFLDDAHSSALSRAYHYREEQRAATANLAMFISAILATLVLYFWAKKIQAQKQLLEQKAENERLLSAAEDLRTRLGLLRKAEKRSGAALSADTLDRLCEQYYIYEGTDNLQPRILKEVRSIVDGLRSDPSVRRSIEQALDGSNDGVMTSLRKDFGKWKDEDFQLFSFVAAGFSPTTISTLLEKDKPYVYNRVYRLKERIKASDAARKDDYLSLLNG